MNYDELMEYIEALTAGEKFNCWELIRGLTDFGDFPYEDLSDEQILALYDMCGELWFIAEMSDSYKVTCSEQRLISPVKGPVTTEAKNRGLK